MTSDVIATGSILILFKHIVLSSILVNNRVIVIENRQKNFQLQLQLQLFTFKNFQLQLQLQLQQNRVINYNFVNYNYNFSKPGGQNKKDKLLGLQFLWFGGNKPIVLTIVISV